MSGRTIKSLSKGDINLDVSSLANGMYIINLTIDNKPFQQKIVVSKK
ncbi:MAG: T9SS type A sorting domain-containing protein [Flavobacterium sp.]|nr:T9SS type A sorting domain-containing protein [Flavobacterium sp.]